MSAGWTEVSDSAASFAVDDWVLDLGFLGVLLFLRAGLADGGVE